MIIGKTFSFCAAHQLPHHEGQCKRFHGHNYKLEVQVEGDLELGPEKETGMVLDFGVLTKIVEGVIADYDHRNLNDFLPNPTAEYMLMELSVEIQHRLPTRSHLKRLKLWETDKCFALLEF